MGLLAKRTQIRGGSLIIAQTNINGTITGDYVGHCTITLHGTNPKLAAVHGGPRETPIVLRGREAVEQSSGMLGVMGTVILRGRRVGHSWALLEATVREGDSRIMLDRRVTWRAGQEVAIR
jgi:hypothetical protein